jgi:predicted transporter
MMLWILCSLAGLLTTLLSPLLIGAVIKLLAKWARRYPDLTETIAIIIMIIVCSELLGVSALLAATYHHIIVGTP